MKAWIIGVAAAVIAAGLLYSHVRVYARGSADGERRIQDRWDAAEAATLNLSLDARDEAEAAIPPVTADPVSNGGDPVPAGKRVCLDAYDRDCP